MLKFDEATHRYTWNGKPTWSVTQVLKEAGLTEPYIGIDPAVLDFAAERGSAVHKCIELLVVKKLDWDSVDERCLGYLEAYLDARAKLKFDTVLSEEQYYSERWDFAGTVDAVLLLPGFQKVVVDFKTSSKLDTAVVIQLAAYNQLIRENIDPTELTINGGAAALRLMYDGKWEWTAYDDGDLKEAWNIFIYARQIVDWKERNGRLSTLER